MLVPAAPQRPRPQPPAQRQQSHQQRNSHLRRQLQIVVMRMLDELLREMARLIALYHVTVAAQTHAEGPEVPQQLHRVTPDQPAAVHRDLIHLQLLIPLRQPRQRHRQTHRQRAPQQRRQRHRALATTRRHMPRPQQPHQHEQRRRHRHPDERAARQAQNLSRHQQKNHQCQQRQRRHRRPRQPLAIRIAPGRSSALQTVLATLLRQHRRPQPQARQNPHHHQERKVIPVQKRPVELATHADAAGREILPIRQQRVAQRRRHDRQHHHLQPLPVTAHAGQHKQQQRAGQQQRQPLQRRVRRQREPRRPRTDGDGVERAPETRVGAPEPVRAGQQLQQTHQQGQPGEKQRGAEPEADGHRAAPPGHQRPQPERQRQRQQRQRQPPCGAAAMDDGQKRRRHQAQGERHGRQKAEDDAEQGVKSAPHPAMAVVAMLANFILIERHGVCVAVLNPPGRVRTTGKTASAEGVPSRSLMSGSCLSAKKQNEPARTCRAGFLLWYRRWDSNPHTREDTRF